MLNVPGSTSASTGVAPWYRTAFTVAIYVRQGTITSSPGPIPIALRATSSAAVPVDTATALRTPTYFASSVSSAFTFGPMLIHPDRSESNTSLISPSSIDGRAQGTDRTCSERGCINTCSPCTIRRKPKRYVGETDSYISNLRECSMARLQHAFLPSWNGSKLVRPDRSFGTRSTTSLTFADWSRDKNGRKEGKGRAGALRFALRPRRRLRRRGRAAAPRARASTRGSGRTGTRSPRPRRWSPTGRPTKSPRSPAGRTARTRPT